jgi:DNA topoisomerase IB
VLAAVELAGEGPPSSSGGAERAIRAAIKRVAERLGNTPAVCRSSYIDPRVLDRFRQGETIEPPRIDGDGAITPRQQARVERLVLELIE